MKTCLPLSTAVALAALTGCMSTADTNAKRPAGGAVVVFHKLDANNDGKLTYAEFNAGFADAMFAFYNRDASGSITGEEFNTIARADAPKEDKTFRALDLNHDGKLTRDELDNRHSARRNAVVRRIFNTIDKNHDGVITEDEAQYWGINRAADQDPQSHP